MPHLTSACSCRSVLAVPSVARSRLHLLFLSHVVLVIDRVTRAVCVLDSQECARMNVLLAEIKRSLLELNRGLEGQLNMSEAMTELAASLLAGEV